MDPIFNKILKMNNYARVASEGLITDVSWYIDTGNYMLNALLSGSIYKGLPGNKIVGFAGQPSSGKSYLTLHLIKNFLALNENYKVVYIDTEGALDTTSLKIVGMDTDRIVHQPIKELEIIKNELAQTLETVKEELKKNKNFTKENKYLFIIDSLGMPPTTSEIDNSLNNDTKEDMGKRNKLIKSIFRICTTDLALFQYPMICTTHTYDVMQQYQPRGISGGKGMIFAGAYLVELTVAKDKDGTDVSGAIVTATLRKSRLSKQYASVKVLIDYAKGLDRYYGLLDFALKSKIIQVDGKKLLFPDGNKYWREKEVLKEPEKYFTKNILDAIDLECQKYFLYGTQLDEEIEGIETENETEDDNFDLIEEFKNEHS